MLFLTWTHSEEYNNYVPLNKQYQTGLTQVRLNITDPKNVGLSHYKHLNGLQVCTIGPGFQLEEKELRQAAGYRHQPCNGNHDLQQRRSLRCKWIQVVET